MKVLVLLTDGLGGHGGIARYNSDLLAALSAFAEIEQSVVLPRFSGESAMPLARVTQHMAEPSRARWCLKALRLAVSGQFDVILCGHLNALPFAATLARIASAKLWLQLHGIEAWTARGRLYRSALRRVDLVTAVSRYTRRRFLSWSDIEPWRVKVLPNTVSPEFRPRPKPAYLVTRHSTAGRKVILTVGRLSETERYKGHDRIIRVLAEVRRQCPEALYLVAGSGADQPRLEALAAAEGVAEHVIFTGRVAEQELPDYFALADVFAMPSTGEGFGIVFLEATACGLPVIAGNRDGSTDALADGAIGVLIDPHSSDQLARAIVAGLEQGRKTSPDAVGRFAAANFTKHLHAILRDFAAAVPTASTDAVAS